MRLTALFALGVSVSAFGAGAQDANATPVVMVCAEPAVRSALRMELMSRQLDVASCEVGADGNTGDAELNRQITIWFALSSRHFAAIWVGPEGAITSWLRTGENLEFPVSTWAHEPRTLALTFARELEERLRPTPLSPPPLETSDNEPPPEERRTDRWPATRPSSIDPELAQARAFERTIPRPPRPLEDPVFWLTALLGGATIAGSIVITAVSVNQPTVLGMSASLRAF